MCARVSKYIYHLLINHLGGCFTEGLLKLIIACPVLVRKYAKLFVESVDSHLRVGHLGDTVEVVRGAGSDALEKHLFRNAAAESHAHSVEHLLLRVQRCKRERGGGNKKENSPRACGSVTSRLIINIGLFCGI